MNKVAAVVLVASMVIASLIMEACTQVSVETSATVSLTKPLKQTRDVDTFKMTVKIIPEDEIEETCDDLGVPYRANGCSTFNRQTKECVLYVMPQRFQQDEERLIIIGHETWHCRYGEWHDF